MAPPSAGTIVLVRFPFSDLSRTKLRPAVTLADVGRGDFVLCQLTSKPYADARAVEITDASLSEGSLRQTSYARPGKLFTANKSLIARQVATLSPEMRDKVIDSVVALLRRTSST